MRALFVDANETLAAVTDKLLRSRDLPVSINRNPSIKPDDLPNEVRSIEKVVFEPFKKPEIVSQLERAGHAEVELHACQHCIDILDLSDAVPPRRQ